MTARDFFDAVRAASVDAERCRRQLEALEAHAKSIGGGGYEPRTRSTPDPHRMEGRVVAYVDRDSALSARMNADYELIDRACVLLYGDDDRAGMDSVVSPLWSDVLWWRYLDAADWRTVAHAVGYSVRPCQLFARAALDWVDETRFMAELRNLD